MQGPTPQLAVFGVKLIDLLEDDDKDRRESETAKLSLSIIESLVLHIQQSIDIKAQQAVNKGHDFPKNIRDCSDNLLVILGKSRGFDDKGLAKQTLLKSMAEALRSLSSYTKATYPAIVDANGNTL